MSKLTQRKQRESISNRYCNIWQHFMLDADETKSCVQTSCLCRSCFIAKINVWFSVMILFLLLLSRNKLRKVLHIIAKRLLRKKHTSTSIQGISSSLPDFFRLFFERGIFPSPARPFVIAIEGILRRGVSNLARWALPPPSGAATVWGGIPAAQSPPPPEPRATGWGCAPWPRRRRPSSECRSGT